MSFAIASFALYSSELIRGIGVTLSTRLRRAYNLLAHLRRPPSSQSLPALTSPISLRKDSYCLGVLVAPSSSDELVCVLQPANPPSSQHVHCVICSTIMGVSRRMGDFILNVVRLLAWAFKDSDAHPNARPILNQLPSTVETVLARFNLIGKTRPPLQLLPGPPSSP
jgi:hypothetical protein